MELTQGLHRAVQQTPDAAMTIFGARVQSCAEFEKRVARLAGAFLELDVRTGDRVGMLALNSDRYLEYLAAVPWAGAVLNPVNIRWSTQEVVYSLVDSGTTVLLVDDAFASKVPELVAGCDALKHVVFCGEGPIPDGALALEQIVADAAPVPDARRGGGDLAGIFYTGGTTGFPKGVMLSHRAIVSSALGSLASGQFLRPGGRFLHAAPMFHLADLAAWAAQTLIGGAHIIVPAFEPVAVMRAIAAEKVTSVLLVPTMLQMLLDHPQITEHDLSSLELVVYGASPISPATLERAASVLPGVGFTQAYGMTELAPVATLLGPSDHRSPDPDRARLASAGRAAPHAEVRIADADGVDVPPGTVGEVLVSGPNVMLGYWQQPEETEAALRDGWMHTGDAAWMDEQGYIYIVDRFKDMIVSGGENVYSAEVERAIGAHPLVAACAVIGVPDEDWGERVHAVIVPRDGASLTAEEVRRHTAGLIAGYKAPRSVEFVDALPLSAAGKVLKTELKAAHWGEHARAVN